MASGPRNEAFGRLLSGAVGSIASYEGKRTVIVEEELGAALAVSPKTVQRYKTGYVPPDDGAVRTLAVAGVRRGMLSQEWLERFLHAARYPQSEQLVRELFPQRAARERPPRVYENLPAPTYSQFVMRPQAFADVIDGLAQRTAVALIVGLGGNGKTSLAREVAAHLLGGEGACSFDAVVWVSDKDRPGTTNLSVVLDTVARTLDYPVVTQLAPAEKQYEVEQLLRRQPTLLVVDNVETITDQALLHWLLRLPEPSKALLTSRERHRALWGSWLIELRGMADGEAQRLALQRMRQLGLPVAEAQQLAPLVAVTGGNPKALAIAVGLVKYERRTLQQVVDDLHAARGDLFADLFHRAWDLLDEAARRILLTLSLFPNSAAAEALAATADVGGYGLDRALERLVDLSLLDVQQVDLQLPARYTLHPLVRAFATVRREADAVAERAARERWLRWHVDFVEAAGGFGYDLGAFARFAPEQEGTYAAASWAHQHGYHHEALTLSRKANYFYYVRGIWDKNVVLNQIGAEAARALANPQQELLMLAYSVQRLLMQVRLGEAEEQLATMRERLAEGVALPGDVLHTVHHTFGLHALLQGRLDDAEAIWAENLERAVRLQQEGYHVITRLWLATVLQERGEFDEAAHLAADALADAQRIGYTRAVVTAQLRLAALDLERGQFATLEGRLQAGMAIATLYQDRPNIARLRYLAGRLAGLRGDAIGARVALSEAVDHYQRLGLTRDLEEAQRALVALTSSTEP